MMTFTVSKVLALLMYPLSLSFLLCLVAMVFGLLRRKRLSFVTTALALGWLYLCSTALFANFLNTTLEQDFLPRAMSAVQPADAIVLLGGATRGDTHMGTLADLNQRADRLVHAVALYKAGKAPVILVAGGGAAGARTEAEQMRDILVIMGVPARHLLLETGSRNTRDNAVLAAQMLKRGQMQRILLVTSANHMRRARALFAAQGLQVEPAPTDYQRLVVPPLLPAWLPTVASLQQSTDALHEIVGYWMYRFRGWL